jgi:alkylation response protein AidB-like acyl-CoA dehydrogenase
MDVRFSPEQQALRDSAAQVVDRLGVHTVADLDDPERHGKLDAAVRAAGWRELRAASDTGGPWASGVEVAIVAEELGRGLADVAFAGPTLAAELRRIAGVAPAPSTETIVLDGALAAPAVADRDSLGGVAVAFDAEACTSGLVVDQDGVPASVRLAGRRAEVDLTRCSVRIEPAPVATIDGATGRIDADARDLWTALGLALTCADLVGVMRGAVALATDYAAERRQFGTAVGSFQAVQHLLADALVAAEGASSVTRHAAWAVDALEPPDALAAGAVAKAYCSRAARTVCETAIQVHGGIGNTWECLAHVYLRRALLSIDVLGGVGPSLARVLAHRGIGDGDGLR